MRNISRNPSRIGKQVTRKSNFATRADKVYGILKYQKQKQLQNLNVDDAVNKILAIIQ